MDTEHPPVLPRAADRGAVLDTVIELLRRISEILAEGSWRADARSRMAALIAESLHLDECCIFLFNEKRSVLELAASYTFERHFIEHLMLKPGEGLIGYTFSEKQTLNVANARFHPRYKDIPELNDKRLNSFLGIPLIAQNRAIGVLAAMNSSPELFDIATVDAMRSIAPQFANMVCNTDIFEAVLSCEAQQSPVPAPGRTTTLNGITVSSGVAIGYAYKIKRSDDLSLAEPRYSQNAEQELTLLQNAVEQTKRQTIELEKRSLSLLSEADAGIFTTHLLMLDDHLLTDYMRERVVQDSVTAETALCQTYAFFEKKFLALSEPVFRERVNDLKDVLLRMLENMGRLRDSGEIVEGKLCTDNTDIILIAEELLPSELMRLPIDTIRAIVCEKGSITSHAAILAKSLEIPALMGVRNLMESVVENELVLVDAHNGSLHINPDEALCSPLADAIANTIKRRDAIREDRDYLPEPAKTADAYHITLRANISLLNEIAQFHASHAQGIGLYRTEFLFMMRDALPSEQDQYTVYSKLVRAVGHEAVTIRALDIGADKPVSYIHLPHEENPALGIRGVRLLRQKPEIALPHIRAILRAGSGSALRILLPMISSVSELLYLKEKIRQIQQNLKSQNIPHLENYRLGMMLETPSMIFELERVLPELDFISVGTNDLSQYLFAADRGNADLHELTDPLNPAFFRVLSRIAQSCYQAKVPVSVCGEMAGNVAAIPVLIGLGFYELSCAPQRIKNVRSVIQAFDIASAQNLAADVCGMETPEQARQCINKALQSRGITPEPSINARADDASKV